MQGEKHRAGVEKSCSCRRLQAELQERQAREFVVERIHDSSQSSAGALRLGKRQRAGTTDILAVKELAGTLGSPWTRSDLRRKAFVCLEQQNHH
jgi:hypothetical protein